MKLNNLDDYQKKRFKSKQNSNHGEAPLGTKQSRVRINELIKAQLAALNSKNPKQSHDENI